MTDVVRQEPWWSLLLRGTFIVVLGVLLILASSGVWLVTTVVPIFCSFGGFALLDGIFATSVSVKGRKRYKQWRLILLGGLAGIVAGILFFVGPLIAPLLFDRRFEALYILYLFAAWLAVTGIIRVITGIRARKEAQFVLPLACGIVSVCFGVLIIITPLIIARLLFGAGFAIIIGAFLLVDAAETWERSRATS